MKNIKRYHPDRYRLLRPYSKQITSLYQSLTGTSNLPTYETFESICKTIAKFYNEGLEGLAIESRPNSSKRLVNEQSLAMHYSAWSCQGRQIFHFNNEIVQQFRITDVNEIPTGSLKFPYNVFYMSFGIQSDLDLCGDGSFVDGAYISILTGDLLQIVLTTNNRINEDEGKSGSGWIVNKDEYYYLDISLKDLTQPISLLAEQALKKNIDDRNSARQKAHSYVEFDNLTIKSNKSKNITEEIADLEGGFQTFKESLCLIINGLCYLSAYSDDIDLSWPEDTPKSMLDKIKNATKPKEIQRTTSKLVALGYTKIHYCGKAFERILSQLDDGGKEIRAHWRRGHWRNQPHGFQLASRKVIWIMPVLVRKDKELNLEETGHIYLCDSISGDSGV